jgi:hypothetical protein
VDGLSASQQRHGHLRSHNDDHREERAFPPSAQAAHTKEVSQSTQQMERSERCYPLPSCDQL